MNIPVQKEDVLKEPSIQRTFYLYEVLECGCWVILQSFHISGLNQSQFNT